MRNATVAARGEGAVYVLGKAAFDAALASAPSLLQQVRNSYFTRQ